MRVAIIDSSIRAPSVRYGETDGKVIDGLWMKVDGELLNRAYLYKPEDVEKALELLRRHWNERRELETRHACEINQLPQWRLK